MSFWTLLAITVASAGLSAYTRAYQRATLYWGVALGARSGSPRGLQDLFTPPAQIVRSLGAWLLFAAVVVAGFVEFGFLVCVGIVVGRFILSAAIGAAMPDAHSSHFSESIFASLEPKIAKLTRTNFAEAFSAQMMATRFRKMLDNPLVKPGEDLDADEHDAVSKGFSTRVSYVELPNSFFTGIGISFQSPEQERLFRRTLAKVDDLSATPNEISYLSDEELVARIHAGPGSTLESATLWELSRRERMRRTGEIIELVKLSPDGLPPERMRRLEDDLDWIEATKQTVRQRLAAS